ncbi:hypothetical protein GCM10010329_54120 [Streptomyces spiroverticillatus]|uniref:Uncharacterized protein n=1 Tax=Streptomyces finlayi TaxID=67296 RepID=A0A918X280_9ACTN|nr:hypothetical protein [Streptomyces finlayi]GHA23832.1 hypothetical protein GCM10010329_54120 [Streptomyces spiroverticillatus]GHD04971.1 hypothetical protein GCM10010334_55040 [Streptomyces finlayi]
MHPHPAHSRPLKPLPELYTGLALAVAAVALWAAWLGWDQVRDVQPDGGTTGPYEPWQVIGLVLTLLLPVCWAAYKRLLVGPVLGVAAGLTVAAFYDWSDDASGLFVIGVGMIAVGSLIGTAVVVAVVNGLAENRRRRSHAVSH